MQPSAAPASLRIVHCVRAPIGGIFRHVLDLAEAQSRAGHLVGIVLDSTTGGRFEADKIAQAAPHLALGVTRLPMSRTVRPSDLVALWRVHSIIANLHPDVLHGHGAKGGTFARLIGTLLSRYGKPVARFYTPHGGSLHLPATLCGRTIFRIERLLERLCDGLIHVSRYEADTYLAKVGTPRCEASVIHNGVSPEEFGLVTPDEDAADFVYMGMVRALKGTDVLIRAAAILLERNGACPRIAILGDGPDRPAYQQLVADLGLGERVTFHDPMPTRVGLARGHCLVVPSRAESMPYIVLEAMAAGLPLVASRVGGIPEIVGPLSDRLVAPGDAVALADALEHVHADLAEARLQSLRVRATLRRRFTLATMTDQVERVYRIALAGRRDDATGTLPGRLQPAG